MQKQSGIVGGLWYDGFELRALTCAWEPNMFKPQVLLAFLFALILTTAGCDASTTLAPTTFVSTQTTTTASTTQESSFTSISTLAPLLIAFDLADGSPTWQLSLSEPGKIPAVTDPMRIGHAFLGWSSSSLCQTIWLFDEQIATESMTLFACWEVLTFTLSFVHDGKTLSTFRQPYGTEIAFPEVQTALGYRLVGWISNLTDELFEASTVPAENLVLLAKIELERLSLPVLSIRLNVDIDQVDKYTYVDAIFTMWDETGQPILSESTGQFRGRGNGSWWTIDKKGYRIKLDDKASVFGLAPSKHWVLVPGTYDYGTSRNGAAYTLTNEVFDGIEYTTSVHYVDVYVNGEYYGLYNWFEKVRVEEGRVDLESEYGVIDTGYLIEYDSYACCVEGIDYFWIPGLRYDFTVHSPEPDEWSDAVTEADYRLQIAAIKRYMQDVVNAIFEDDQATLETLVDLDSMVDFYLIHELFKNTDTGWSSVFLYKKPGGKLYFGPLWDFDFTAGVSRGESHPEGLYVADTIRYSSDFTSSEIFIELMTQSWFVARVKSRWLAIDQDAKAAITRFYESLEPYHDSFERDARAWPWQAFWQDEQEWTKSWLLTRCDWLTQWASR